MKIWDIYTRIFHWSLVVGIVVSLISGLNENMDLHISSAKFVAFLMIFRLIWGIIGYPTAKFSFFVANIKDIKQYFSSDKKYIGHSPVGALSVVVILSAIAIQLITGLFTTDEVLFEAPFYHLVGASTQELIQDFHEEFFVVLILLIITHISAIIFYKIRGKNLVKNMITGGFTEHNLPAKYTHLSAFVAITISSTIVYFIFY